MSLFCVNIYVDNVAHAAKIITDLTPIKSAYGNIRQISLSLPQWQAGAKISIQPGGPIVTHQISLPSAASHLVYLNGLIYAAVNNSTDKNEVIAIRWDSEPKIIARYKVANHIRHMQLDGSHIIIAVDNHGIEWLDVSSPEKIGHSGYFKIDGFLNAVSVNKKILAYTKQHNSIQILNVSQSGNGKITASRQKTVHVSHPINDLWITTNLLYVASEQTGLTLFDISKPKQTTMLSGFKTTGSALSMQVKDQLVYIADGAGGLSILDASKPAAIVWRGSHNKIGAVNRVMVNDKLAIINNANRRLASLNIDKPELPITQALYKPKHNILATTLSDTNVYIAVGNEIQKLDYSQVAPTQISHSGVNQGGSRRAYIDNDIAYVADWFSGLHIYDIRIPRQPRHLGNYHTPGSSKGVVVKNSIAYIGDDDHGLQIVDVSNPRKPVKISEVLTTGLAYTLKLVNDRVYLADHRGGLHIIDVSDIKKPTIIGSFDTPGKSWALDVKDNLVFVADDLSGLLVFDVSNPSAPKQIGQFQPGGYAEDVVIVDNIAYVTFFDQGLYALDISKPQSITEISHINIPGNARSIAIKDGYAYISGWESGLQIIDISRSKYMTHVGYIDTDGSTWGADIQGHYAYLWDWWGGIKVVDVSNARNPTLVGRYQGRSRIQQLQKRGDYAYAANGSSGMQVFDISNPLNPIWVTALEMSGFANHIALSDNMAYLALGDTGIAKVDISDPFNPRWLSSTTTSGYSQSIQQRDGYIYVAQQSGGIDVIDARSRHSLNPIAQLPMAASDLLITSNLLLVAHSSGVSSYKLVDPAKAEHLQTISLAHDAKQLTMENDIVAVLYGDKSIQLMRVSNTGLRSLRQIEHKDPVSNILINNGRLYIYSNVSGLKIEMIKEVAKNTSSANDSSNKKADLSHVDAATRYPATGQYQSMLAHKNSILFSGQASLASLDLLPTITWQATGKKQLQLTLPKKLPLGDYHVELELASGQKYTYPNLIQVILGVPKKPQMSMEQFKKLLKQHTQKSSPSPAAATAK